MRVVYIDDEKLAILRFNLMIEKMKGIESVDTFQNPLEGLEFIKKNKVDVAFLDIEMPQIRGIDLARKIKEVDENIRIIFMTAYSEYALDAFDVDAVGYLLKPYSKEKLEKELLKARRVQDIPKNRVYIQTMPNFDVFIDGKLLPIARKKSKELLALLVDKHGNAITAGQAIAYLWEDRMDDEATKALYRMTMKRLKDTLIEAGVEYILGGQGSQKCINVKSFDCDYYDFLDGDEKVMRKYNGEYMAEYSWAEETNAKLYDIIYGEG